MNLDRTSNSLHWFLSFGCVVFLTSPFWADSKSNITTSFYLGFLLPTVLISVIRFRELSDLLGSTSFRIYLLFGFWATLSIIWSDSNQNLISLAKRPLYVAAVFVGFFFLIRWSETRFHATLRISALVATLWMGWWLYIFNAAGGTPADRFMGFGPSVNPVHFSQVLGFYFLYWLISWWHGSQRLALLEIAGIIVFLLALVYANSRSPFLGIVLAIVLVSTVKRDRKVIFLLLAMCAILTFFYLTPSIRILEPNTSYRFDVWREVFFKFRESPLLGHGFDGGIAFLVPKLGVTFTDTHSIHVGVLYDLGVVGFIIWLGLYASLARDFLKSTKTFLVLLSGCVTIYGVGSGMTDGMTYISRAKEHWFIIWIPISILVASVLAETKPPHRPSLPS